MATDKSEHWHRLMLAVDTSVISRLLAACSKYISGRCDEAWLYSVISTCEKQLHALINEEKDDE